MTKKELIDALKEYPEDVTIIVYAGAGRFTSVSEIGPCVHDEKAQLAWIGILKDPVNAVWTKDKQQAVYIRADIRFSHQPPI